MYKLSMAYIVTEEGLIQKTRQRSSLLFVGQNLFNSFPILHQDDFKNIINSSFPSYHPGGIHPFLHIILVEFILFFLAYRALLLWSRENVLIIREY